MTADSLVVDIGGDTGALIVCAPPDLVGREFEIARAETSSAHPVRARRVGPWVVHAAAFPDLPAGTYRRYRNGVGDEPSFAVAGGLVTEIDWAPPRASLMAPSPSRR